MINFRQRSSDKPLETKSKAIIYPTNILDQKQLKNLKPDTLHLFVEPGSHIFDSTETIMRE